MGGEDLARWSQSNFYRTSYNDMSSKSPTHNKNTVIPGYQGHLPKLYVENVKHGKRVTEQTREIFNSGLDEETKQTVNSNLSATMFGLSLNTRLDKHLEATSRRFGRRTNQETAPNMKPEKKEYANSSFRQSYRHPSGHDRPNYRRREAGKDALFDNAKLLSVNQNSATLVTGYESNRQLWDGTTWRTEKNQHTDQFRTSYRNEFNKPKPFHLNKLKDTTGRLRKMFKVYDLNDNPTAHPQ